MPSKRRETQLQTGAGSECRHYWEIDSSQQAESKGRCRLCGEERTFQNIMAFPSKRPGVVVEAAPVAGDATSRGPDDSGALVS
jgi:hypothetical protein